jgi:hypothetical protein
MPMSQLFKAPPSSTTPPPPSPSSPTEDSLPPSPSPSQAEPSWSTAAADSPSAEPDDPSGIRSTGKGLKLSKAGLRAVIGTGFRKVCGVAAAILAAEEERLAWAPDTEDVEDVANPATSLLYRRIPDEARGGDVIDLIALALALAGYLGKSAAAAKQHRTMRQLQEQAGVAEAPADQGPQYTAGGGF